MKHVVGVGILAVLSLLAVGCGGESTADRDGAVVTDGSEGGTLCDRLCTTLDEVGCPDNSACETALCPLATAELCAAEGEAYLECVAMANPETDFQCEDGRPNYVDKDCIPVINAYVECNTTPP